ncbi:VF530 family DNA-binding protein, partial [Vibrio parahaemolyticus]|nr:VF530 family DNA-binding protein [Vibrio parahaemolyticus]
MNQQVNNPLHGLSLEKIVTRLVEHYGWSGLHQRIN